MEGEEGCPGRSPRTPSTCWAAWVEIGGATPTAAPPNMEVEEVEALEGVEVWEVEGALEEVPLIVAHSTIVEVEW